MLLFKQNVKDYDNQIIMVGMLVIPLFLFFLSALFTKNAFVRALITLGGILFMKVLFITKVIKEEY